MGKASSNKKIARAQRAGSKSTAGQQRGWLYPVSLTLVFVLGILLVVVARSGRDAEATGPPRLTDHWHAAYSVVICDEPQAPITDETDPKGIHTHGDGVIHIHPFSESAAGNNATLGEFMDASGLDISDDKISVPGGREVVEGTDKCGDADAQIRVARWESADLVDSTEPQIFSENFDNIRFIGDREAITVFFGPADADIPVPNSIGELDQLTDVAPESPLGTAPDGTPIAVPGPTGETPAEPTVSIVEETPASDPPAGETPTTTGE